MKMLSISVKVLVSFSHSFPVSTLIFLKQTETWFLFFSLRKNNCLNYNSGHQKAVSFKIWRKVFLGVSIKEE